MGSIDKALPHAGFYPDSQTWCLTLQIYELFPLPPNFQSLFFTNSRKIVRIALRFGFFVLSLSRRFRYGRCAGAQAKGTAYIEESYRAWFWIGNLENSRVWDKFESCSPCSVYIMLPNQERQLTYMPAGVSWLFILIISGIAEPPMLGMTNKGSHFLCIIYCITDIKSNMKSSLWKKKDS